MHLIGLKGEISLPFQIFQVYFSEIQCFHIPEACKRNPLRAEPPRTGHYREYSPTNLVPRALFPGFGGGAGKGPGIGRSIRHFDWLIDLGNLCKKMTK